MDLVFPDVKQSFGRYIASQTDMDDAIRFCHKRNVVVQAGGHCGVWPIRLAKMFKRVYTFEPDFKNFKCLVSNIKEPNIFPARGVLGAYPHFVGLHLNEKNTGGHWVKGDGDVPVYTIDGLHLNELDLIILDVEGSELFALQGAARSIEQFSPVIMFEDNGNFEFKGGYPAQDVYDLMESFGYKHVSSIGNDKIWVKHESGSVTIDV